MKNKVISLFGNNKIVQNEGVKYSKLLEQFMEPFVKEFEDIEYVEDIFEFAINAWNFGNMQIIIPNEEFEKSISSIQDKDDNTNLSLLKKMVDYKVQNFKEHTNFMVDFELKETERDPILSFVTQEEEAYLANMMDTLENEVTQDDFEENYINRSAIILKPQQPFVDWYFNLNPEDELDFEEEIKETNIYLVDDEIDIEKWLKKKFDKFFMMELDEWCVDKKQWPQKRNYKMFKLWFRVEISEIIYDLEKKPVLKSE